MDPDQALIPDEVLVVSSILGDLQAFDELVRRYHAAVLRLAATMVGGALAEDVAQEAWLLAFKALPSIDAPEKFGSWLMVITKNRANRAYSNEKKRNDRHVAMDSYLLEQFYALHTKSPASFEENEWVRRALEHIPEEYSMALRMRFFDALPLERIASFLDVPLSTVKWRVFRGKQLLKEQLDRLEKTL